MAILVLVGATVSTRADRGAIPFQGIPLKGIDLPHDPVSLSAAELRSLDKDIDKLLDHQDDVKLRIWEVNGDFSSFDRDILAR